MSVESLNKLLSIAPPPDTPLFTGHGIDNSFVENTLGTKLPRDYIDFIRIYGDSVWYEHILFLSVFRSDEFSLWNWHKKNIDQLSRLFADPYPVINVKHSIFPEKGGLLLCGGDVFGEHIAWITEGEPDGWPLVYFDSRFCMYDRYDIGITTFLLNLIEEKINPSCFPCDIREQEYQSIVSVDPFDAQRYT